MIYKIGDAYIYYSQSDMDDNEIVIDYVYVPVNQRRQGIGTKLIQYVIEIGEKEGKNIGLFVGPGPDSDMSTSELVEYFRSLGFKSDREWEELMTYYIT